MSKGSTPSKASFMLRAWIAAALAKLKLGPKYPWQAEVLVMPKSVEIPAEDGKYPTRSE